MPLLTSPIDGSPMRQIRRYGIEIDVCPSSGGVWLDKGELEKILHFIQDETEVNVGHASGGHGLLSRHSYHDDDDDGRRYKERGYYGSGKYHGKKSKMSRIMDLFDF